MKPVCPYCKSAATLVEGNVIYPHREDLHGKYFWSCAPCDAYVGCHAKGATTVHPRTGKNVTSDGTFPLGRLANAELRNAKRRAHNAFDNLWVHSERRGRARILAYAWLATELGMSRKECHIGLFDVRTCERVVELCQKRGPVLKL